MVGHTQIPAIPSSSFPICICRRQIAAPPPPEISPPAVHPQTDPSVAGCCKSGSKQSRSVRSNQITPLYLSLSLSLSLSAVLLRRAGHLRRTVSHLLAIPPGSSSPAGTTQRPAGGSGNSTQLQPSAK
uniref:Uncharacterized protein n=1 Tax=Leersia perrieri TaxID=77586 RepID=A0A0D9X7H2_9ORYZ